MLRISLLISCIFFVCPAFVFCQTPAYPQGYFRWPLNLAPEIVANLGELRPNHWHMGLDIRTAQQVNQPVYAAAGGYIARIGIKPTGFGRFLVINHPNGLSTLYAHLNKFSDAIESFATAAQYRQENWELDLEPEATQFPLTKGQLIAYSGSTGSSQGPHVHFEIRDTRSGKCLNPLLFGMPLQDKVSPSLVKLALYDRTKSSYTGAPKFFPVKNTDSGSILPNIPVVKTGSAKISFGIQAFDRISGSSNQDGIYSAELVVDEQPVIRFIIDSIGYDKTAYMNAHIDYPLRYNGGAFIQHLSQLPGERSGVYHPLSGDGTIILADTIPRQVKIIVKDAYQNTSILQFRLQLDETMTRALPLAASGPQFLPNAINKLDKQEAAFYLPEECLYDSVPSFYYRSTGNSTNTLSAIHQLNDPSIPVQGNFTVRLKSDKASVPAEWQDRLLIQRSYRNSRTIRKAQWNDQWISASFDDFGNFQAFVDIIPPVVNELGNGDTINLSAAKQISFTPTDNFGIKSFRAELDGKWLRFTNDKARTWIYVFDERCPDGVHELKVTVTDIAGNQTIKTWWFKKYPYTPPPKKKVVKKKTSSKKAAAPKKKTTPRKK